MTVMTKGFFPSFLQGISSPQGAAVIPLLETVSYQGLLATSLFVHLTYSGDIILCQELQVYKPCTLSPIKMYHLIPSRRSFFKENCIYHEKIPPQNSSFFFFFFFLMLCTKKPAQMLCFTLPTS